MKESDILTIDEAAETLGYSRRYLYTLMEVKGFPRPFTKAGTKLFWSKQVKAWGEKHGKPHSE